MAARARGTIGLVVATLLGTLLLAASASATSMSVTSGVLDLAIPDGDGSSLTSWITLPGGTALGNVLQDLSVEVAIDHTWVGDLTLRLTAPDATVITLVDQPGIPASFVGSDLDRAHPLWFHDAYAMPSWRMGIDCDSDEVIGEFCTTEHAPSDPIAGVLGNFFGPWKLEVTDGIPGYPGTLASWTLHTTFVPAPEPTAGALVALGLAGLALRRPARCRRSR